MNEDALAILLIFGFVPALFAFIWWVRPHKGRGAWPWQRRGTDIRDLVPSQPDGRTLIELEKLRLADRDKARALFERLSMEKIDMLRVALNTGYKEEELAKLDERLERIIGSEKLRTLLESATATAPPQAPSKAGEIQSSDLSSAAADGRIAGSAGQQAG